MWSRNTWAARRRLLSSSRRAWSSRLLHRTDADGSAVLARGSSHDDGGQIDAELVTNTGRSVWFIGLLVLMVYLVFAMCFTCCDPERSESHQKLLNACGDAR